MPQATPGDWWYTHGASISYPTTTTAATTIISNPYLNANTIYPTYQQNHLQQYQQAQQATPPLTSLPEEGCRADYPEIANLRRRISEVTQLCAA